MTLAELHAKMPKGTAFVTAVGSSQWDVQVINVRLAMCSKRDVADYLCLLWNTLAPVETPAEDYTYQAYNRDGELETYVSPMPPKHGDDGPTLERRVKAAKKEKGSGRTLARRVREIM